MGGHKALLLIVSYHKGHYFKFFESVEGWGQKFLLSLQLKLPSAHAPESRHGRLVLSRTIVIWGICVVGTYSSLTSECSSLTRKSKTATQTLLIGLLSGILIVPSSCGPSHFISVMRNEGLFGQAQRVEKSVTFRPEQT